MTRSLGLLAVMAFSTFARSAQPRISYIIVNKTNNIRWAEIHFATEANRAYVLQGKNSLSPATTWTNLHSYFSSPVTNHYIYRDTLTNKARVYRLQATP